MPVPTHDRYQPHTRSFYDLHNALLLSLTSLPPRRILACCGDRGILDLSAYTFWWQHPLYRNLWEGGGGINTLFIELVAANGIDIWFTYLACRWNQHQLRTQKMVFMLRVLAKQRCLCYQLFFIFCGLRQRGIELASQGY